MKRLTATLAALALALPIVGLTAPAGHAVEPIFICNGTFTGRTFQTVVIPDGATCVIRDSVIAGSVRTVGSPEEVRIIRTRVGHNVNVRNVTGTVIIGSADCEIDPFVGNNLKVRDSNNVAVCQMTVDNNIVLIGNTGRMMVRDNTACNSIRVKNNNLIALRVLRNRYVLHLSVQNDNIENVRKVEGNINLDSTPARCRG